MTMEQRHVGYIAAAAITAGTVAAYHLLMKHNSLHVLGFSSNGSSSVTRLLNYASNSKSAHVGAQLVATNTEQAVGQYQWDWAQSLEEVLIEMQLPRHISQQEVQVKLLQQQLTVCVGQHRIISGTLAGDIQPQHSSWHLEGKGGQRVLSISLCKAPALGKHGQFAIWTSLLVTEDDTSASGDQMQRQ